MRDSKRGILASECIALHRYLAGTAPSRYVVEKYALAHDHVSALSETRGWFDVLLLRASHLHPLLLGLVQAYTRIFAPTALARTKAVLVLAIIECCGSALAIIQSSTARGPVRALLASLGAMIGFGAALVVSAILFGPLHVVHAAGVSLHRLVPLRGRAVRKVA